MIKFSYRAARFLYNYSRPISLLFSRATVKSGDVITLRDRATGLTFRVRRPADQMFPETFFLKLYDLPQRRLGPGDVVLDIGANNGFFTCYAAAQGAKVFAFEPQPDTFELLQQNIASNNLVSLVSAFPYALGAEDGSATLHITDRLGGGMSSTQTRYVEKAKVEIKDSVEVPVRQFSSLINSLGIDRMTMLKIDCEGAELAILQDILDHGLDERIDYIAMEYHPEAYNMESLVSILDLFTGFDLSKPNTEMFEAENENLFLVRRGVTEQFLLSQVGD
jgi:FkbM family methyltransferase